MFRVDWDEGGTTIPRLPESLLDEEKPGCVVPTRVFILKAASGVKAEVVLDNATRTTRAAKRICRWSTKRSWQLSEADMILTE
jgi:hypothetical protein